MTDEIKSIMSKSSGIQFQESSVVKNMENKIEMFGKKQNTEQKSSDKPSLDDIEDFENNLIKDDYQESYDFKQNIEEKFNSAVSQFNENVGNLQSQINEEIEKFKQETATLLNQAQVYANSQVTKDINEIQEFDFVQQKKDLIEDFGKKIAVFVPPGYFIKNADDITELKKLINEYKPPKQNSFSSVLPQNNPLEFIENKQFTTTFNMLYENYDKTTNPERNEKLKSRNIIDNNLLMFKDVFGMEESPSIDQVQQMLKLPPDFDMNKLSDFLKTNTDSLPDFDTLKSKLNLPELEAVTDINQLKEGMGAGSGVIANLKGFKKPSVSKPTTGLNFDRMSGTIQNAFSTDFAEDTDWQQVMKFQAHMITQAVFNELSNMKFYIEPGQIKVVTNGSATTQTGNNVNRITIKLK